MNADRSQPGNQRPREAPQSSGGFDDAPTAVQSEPAPSTPVASRDLLFVRFALHNGFINQETLDNALAEQQADASRSLAEILVKSGSISENERGAIEHLCREHVVRHGGDPQQSLDTLSMPPTVSYRQPPGTDTVTFSQRPTDGKQPQGTFGDYELLREIARGGMGRILAAHDRTLDREVALKILLPGANADRFVRESKITARLPHPGIPPVHALGTLADGSPFLAMKLIVGKTLADELKIADRPRLLQAFTQVCQAVGFAHSRGVIHRDLKPANIMVGAFGEVQVMDWGLAKDLASREASGASHLLAAQPSAIVGTDPNRTTDHLAASESTDDRTQAGTVMGTPAYMAPEQARGEPTDARGDVFALGGILCAILTGHPPFTGKSSLEVIQRAASADLAEANAKLDGCGADAELVALCQRCLSPDPVDRPADGQAVADALTAYVNGVQERLQAAERERAVTLAKATEQRKRRRVVAALSAVVVIIMAVGSLAAVEMRNAARAKGLVDSLVSADVAQLPQILTELENQRGRVTPMLVALAGAEPKTADERKVQLHARLALVTHDERQVLPLVEELLTANVSYVGVTRDQLAPYQQHFQGDLWELLHDATKPPARRFRAGLALAGYATNSEQWTPADDAFLVEQLVAANPDHQP
ncbi:MAG TPA: serine/threonine-protein kinase, partial [Pirellulales bacterium]|nr:serine/threonine-protein kinase [Pirellulales bacterium]